MKTLNSHTFQVGMRTDDVETYRFERHHIEAETSSKGRKKPARTRCLLIGFDTEYQTTEPVDRQQIEKGEAQNKILSYQYHIKLVEKGEDKNAPEARGIIVPVDEERLALEDFVAFTIGALVKNFPDVKVPSDVFLVGHFTRADLPAFSEFTNPARKFLSNIRSTFVSIDNHIPIEVVDAGDAGVARLRLHLRDTLLLAPSNAKSLADIGEIVGLKKIKLHEDRQAELHIKSHMRNFRDASWERFRDYAIRDAEVCVRYAEQVIRQYDGLFGQFILPLTLTQFGTKLVLQGWQEAGWKADDMLGQETVKEKKYSKKLGYMIDRTSHPYIEEVFYEAAFVTESYHGGRSEQYAFGISPVGEWRDHDLSSAYTTAMSLIGKPAWKETERLTDTDVVGPLDLAYFSVDFKFPESVRFPVLPVRTQNGIIFPTKGHSICGAPEIFLAKELGATLRFRRGVRVPADRSVPIFRDFIQSSIEKRGQHGKGTFGNLFWKEVGNSTYGKTAQGLRQKRVYDLRADDMVALPESKLTQPFFASFITSFTRAVLGEILNGFPPSVRVFSVTTDGFLSNASDGDVELACSGKLFSAFAKGRKALDGSAEPLEVKHSIIQPIGWRTRGSATLKKGAGETANIVLQKGGIKTKEILDTEEENRHVIDLFLNRHPLQRLEYTVGIGLKDMVRFDADFVSRSVTKRLSMEFDWKRKPVCARDENIEFDGKTYSHLSFETVPHVDREEFQRVRDAWDQYDKKPRRNLKTLDELERFQSYIETRKHPDQMVRRYMRKVDGDLKRLRRDLCSAFVHHLAGFDLVRANKHFTYKEFVAALTAVGIPCTVADIDNAKRQVFVPNMVMSSPKVREALARLRVNHFPEIEENTLLAVEEELQSANSVIDTLSTPI